MAHKKKHTAPVPPGNRPQGGPPDVAARGDTTGQQAPAEGAPLQEQDEKRRLGNFEGAGEHAYQQPGGQNDANH